MPKTRLVRLQDAVTLSELLTANRAFLAPWEPTRDAAFFTPAGQHAMVERALVAHAGGSLVPRVILDGDRIVGTITLSDIVRGVFQSCHLGYWVAEADNGRGHASAAVAEVCAMAGDELGLHRIEAGTLVENARSQKVLGHNGFVRFGLAPRYLKIDGRWQDHVLFQRLLHDR